MSNPAAVERHQDAIDEVLDGLRAFLRTEVLPRQSALLRRAGGRRRIYGEDGRLSPEVLEAMGEVRRASSAAGYYTMFAPERVGGGGLGFEALFRVWELIYRECGAEHFLGYTAVGHWSRGPSHLLGLLSPPMRDKLLGPVMDGTQTLCFAMSEPDAGSDAWMMRTQAQRVEGGWRLSGTKQWVTNAPYADHAFVFAVTDAGAVSARRGGISAFIVPAATPGFRVDSVLEMFGHSGGDEGIISLNDVHVTDDQLVGDLGKGMQVAMSGVSTGRLYNTARSVGLASWALEKAVRYAEERRTFGRPIIDNQGVAFPLADSAMELHAARLVGLDCARSLDRSGLDGGGESRFVLSMAKAYATEMAVRVIDRAMQVHGAMGFTNDVALSEAWQQARRICVADGSAEMLRVQIVKHLRGSVQGS